jgi:hypothetical protein
MHWPTLGAALVAAVLAAAAPAALPAQARHWPRGVYVGIGADAALLNAEETRDLVGVVGPTVGLGIAFDRLSLEMNVRTMAYPSDGPADLVMRYTQVTLQPAVAFHHSPFASLYGGARLTVNRKTSENTRFFLDPAVAGGVGLGLVAGVRALWSGRFGFDLAAYAERQWYGDLNAGGLQLADTETGAAWFGLRTHLVAFPF